MTSSGTSRATAMPMLDAHRLLDCVEDAIIVLDPSLQLLYANAAVSTFLDPDTESTGFDPAALVHPEDLGLAMDGFAHVLHSADKHTLRMRVRENGDWRPVEAVLTNCTDDPSIGGIVICFRNLTQEERYRQSLSAQIELAHSNRALNDQLRERQHFLARLVRIQASISRRAPLAEVLGNIVEGAQQLLGDPTIGLQLQDPEDHQKLLLVAHHGVSAAVQGLVQSAENGIGGTAYRENRLVHTDDLAGSGLSGTVLSGLSVHNGIAVPIRRAGQAIGSLTVATPSTSRTYSAAEREVLESLADHAGIAIMDAQTVESMNEAMTDSLTGLPNRRLLLDRLRQSMDRARRHGRPLALMFIDLDGFKAINDGRGHATGDSVLVEMARRIGAAIRTHDTAARLGGDEFVVLLEETDRLDAANTAARILETIGSGVKVGDRTHVVSATIGVALLDGAEERWQGVVEPDELVRRADIAMYRGKAMGRGKVVFFEDHMEREVEARAELESELRHAISSGSLDVSYQPLFRTADGTMHGVEALARWSSPTQGLVPPTEFIQIATQLGLIVQLDRCVMERACHALLALGPGAEGLELNVNLAPQHIDSPDLVEGLAAVLARTGMPPERVLLEITETDGLRDPDGAVEKLHALRRMGLRMAIDDFGTGYSSLTYLERFPIDVVKVDRDFVVAMTGGGRSRHLVHSMIHLAHSMGLEVVAEGVESSLQAKMLTELGADLVQGFYYHRPIVEHQLPSLLGRLVDEPVVH